MRPKINPRIGVIQKKVPTKSMGAKSAIIRFVRNYTMFKSTKATIFAPKEKKTRSTQKATSITRNSDSFFATLKKINSFASPKTGTTRPSPSLYRKTQIQNKGPQNYDYSHRDQLAREYFCCTERPDLATTDFEDVCMQEFFDRKIPTSDASFKNKGSLIQNFKEDASESLEMVELNNQSIHLSKLYKSIYSNSIQNSHPNDDFTVIRNFESNDTKETNEDTEKLLHSLSMMKGKFLRADIDKDTKDICMGYLSRMSQLLLPKKQPKSPETTFAKLLKKQSQFRKAKGSSKKF